MATSIQAESPADIYNATGKPVEGGDAAIPSVTDVASQLTQAQATDKAAKTPVVEKPAAPVVETPKTETPASSDAVPGFTPKEKPAATEKEWTPKEPKAAEQWNALKKQRDELRSTIEQMKSELQAAKDAGASSEELTKLRDELNQYRETLRDVAIERDPEFNKTYNARQNAAIDAAKMAAGDKADKLEKLLKAPSGTWRDEQITALIDELPASSKRRIEAALGVLEQVDVERSAEIAMRRQNFETKQKLSQEQQQAQLNRAKYELTAAFKNEVAKWTDPADGHPFLTKRDGDEAYNASVDAAFKVAESVHKSYLEGQWSPQDAARAALQVAVAQRATQVAADALQRAEKAEKMLERMRGVQPSGDGRSASVNAEEGDRPTPKPGTEEYQLWVANQLSQAQQLDKQKRLARI